MIVPGFIVHRIYQRGSLKREGDYYSFAFKNSIVNGQVTLTSPDTIQVKSPLGSLELSSFPTLYVDGIQVAKEDAMMVIGGKEVPDYDPEEAARRVGEFITFKKGDMFITRIKGHLPDGKHNFRSVFASREFGEIVLNFSDILGEKEKISVLERLRKGLRSLLMPGREEEREKPATLRVEPVRSTPLYILRGRLPDPDFSRLKMALARKEPDRVPLIELTVDEEVKAAFLGRPLTGMRDEVEFWLATGYDYVPVWALNITPRNVRIISSHETTYKEGLQERAWVMESAGIIKTQEDFKSCQWPDIGDDLFEGFEEIRSFLPPEMKVVGCINAVFETVTQAMGLEPFCYALADDPGLVEDMFNKAGELITICIQKMLAFDRVGAIWVTDDLSHKQGPLISPKLLRKYVFPWHRRFCELVHAKGLPVLYHSCGNVAPILKDIIDCGFDALHPLEPNAMDIYRIKADWGDRICLCGNLDLSYMLTRADLKEIEEDTKRHIERLAPGGGYCLGSANSIPNYVPLENYLTMNRTCLRLGRNSVQG